MKIFFLHLSLRPIFNLAFYSGTWLLPRKLTNSYSEMDRADFLSLSLPKFYIKTLTAELFSEHSKSLISAKLFEENSEVEDSICEFLRYKYKNRKNPVFKNCFF